MADDIETEEELQCLRLACEEMRNEIEHLREKLERCNASLSEYQKGTKRLERYGY